MKTFYFIFALSLLFNIFAVDLIKDGRANGFIHLERNAPAPIRLAADEISLYAEKITGTPLTVGEQKGKTGNYVISFKIETDTELGAEGYRIKGLKSHFLSQVDVQEQFCMELMLL